MIVGYGRALVVKSRSRDMTFKEWGRKECCECLSISGVSDILLVRSSTESDTVGSNNAGIVKSNLIYNSILPNPASKEVFVSDEILKCRREVGKLYTFTTRRRFPTGKNAHCPVLSCKIKSCLGDNIFMGRE